MPRPPSMPDGFRVGLSICYDLRFPELYRSWAPATCWSCRPPSPKPPAARTGKSCCAHVRSRTSAMSSRSGQGGRHENGRETHGNSMLVDPWGNHSRPQAEGPGIVIGDVDPAFIADTAPACRRSNTAPLTMRFSDSLLPAPSRPCWRRSRSAYAILSATFGTIPRHRSTMRTSTSSTAAPRAGAWRRGSSNRAASNRPGRRRARLLGREDGLRVLRRHQPGALATPQRRCAASLPPGSNKLVPVMMRRKAKALYGADDPLASLPADAKVKLLERLEKLCPRHRSARRSRSWRTSPANTKWCWSPAATAALPPTCGHWCASRSRSSSSRTASASRARLAAVAASTTATSRRGAAALREGGGASGGHQPRCAPGAGRHDDRRRLGSGWPGILLHEAVGPRAGG